MDTERKHYTEEEKLEDNNNTLKKLLELCLKTPVNLINDVFSKIFGG